MPRQCCSRQAVKGKRCASWNIAAAVYRTASARQGDETGEERLALGRLERLGEPRHGERQPPRVGLGEPAACREALAVRREKALADARIEPRYRCKLEQ